jgi:hypothetical protein
MSKKTTPASASDKSQASVKKNTKLEEGYRVYLNKHPHLPNQAGRTLFFESHSYHDAVYFSRQLVRNSVEWLVEDIHLHEACAGDAVQRFRKFVENFWIEPVGATPEPDMPFCARRHAWKLLEPHPHILAKVSPLIFGSKGSGTNY